ncbi:protein translocase subunit SecD [Butyricicoccus sp. AF35-5AC]|uniref:protein translocase subunit SecD n=1 Tax=Butyricicoccus sp. AF35-5AC TaxID=2292003 RepID=UPI000E496CD9|nr:protein translocase subunit SecD [Butyricicoccus sp. AF35-5AC]RHP18693.1 protein translocase subunit SecD [Butyricicoccus sp. AF35-5AC]
MKKSVTSFIAVMLIIIFLGVTAVTGVYIPGGWTMPFRNTATSDTSATDTSDTSSTDSSADKADNKADSTDASADTSADSASTDSADTTDSGLKAIIPSVLDTDNGIRLGLDLVGGSRIVYEAEIPDGYDTSNLSDDMNSVQKVIRQRLTGKGFTEATVSLSGDNRVTVEIPQITNPEEAVQTLGTTAQLTFVDADGKEWLTGSDVKKATYGYGRPTGNEVADTHYVEVQFTSEGKQKFAEATESIAARTDGTNVMAIVMDDQVISAPSVSSKIDSDSCVISGSFTRDSATELANLINAGQIPFSLKQVELRSVGPQLGADAMSSSLKAGMIGLLLVMLFMIIMYRVPGVVSCFALCFYMVIEALLFSLIRVNLSLPGIAGIILSIGMAVDANVIIFERIKEEMAAGKTVKSAIDSGFKRAFTAILDSNITTLIACGVLFFLGTGTIVGFATTLGIGVIVSMFTALTITHFLLRRMVDFHIRNPKAYGLRERKEEKKHFPILKNFKIFGGISVVLVATGLVALILLPFGKNLFNLSIDFAGGTEMEFNMHTAVTQDIQTEVSDLFKDATGVDASSVTSSGDGNEDVLIRSTSIDSEQRAAVIDKMLEKYSLADTDILNNNDVSASVGSDLQRSAFLCSILAILLMLVYITFRFELTSGLAAICCLVHDLLVMLSVYVLLQIPLDSNFIAAALTILGYSINASIIVFDRVRENLRTARKEPFEVIGEKSIWQTMGRTINTTLTTLFTIGMVYILGVPSLKQFTLPLIVGILAGGWSSVMLSTGLWGFFRKKFRRRRKI